MRAILFTVLFNFFGLCGAQPLPSLGKVEVKSLCDDAARCEARGDTVYNALKKGSPPYLARSSGAEQYLGKVAPERNPRSVLKTCGAEIKAADSLASAPTIREFVPDKDGKQRIRDAVKAQLVAAMGRAGLVERADADLKANVDAAVTAVDFQKVALVEQTHWLTDASFEKRVGLCGDDFYEQIIYSITVIGLADLFQKDLELKLGAALAAKLIKVPGTDTEPAVAEESSTTDAPAEPATPAEGEAPAAEKKPAVTTRECQDVARDAISELARESRFVAAFGFDNR